MFENYKKGFRKKKDSTPLLDPEFLEEIEEFQKNRDKLKELIQRQQEVLKMKTTNVILKPDMLIGANIEEVKIFLRRDGMCMK